MAIRAINSAQPLQPKPERSASLPPRKRHVIDPGTLERVTAPPSSPEPPPQTAPLEKPKRNRGAGRRDEQGKWHAPEGNEKGFCLPPKDKQFGKGNKMGCRKRKNAINYDDQMRKNLLKTKTITENGKPKKRTNLDLHQITMINDALKGNATARKLLNEESARLFRPPPEQSAPPEALIDPYLDGLTIQQFLAGLTMGEPAPGTANPLADRLIDPLGSVERFSSEAAEDDEGDEESSWDEFDDDEPDDD